MARGRNQALIFRPRAISTEEPACRLPAGYRGKEGIYAFGEKTSRRKAIKLLYAGRTKDANLRLMRHKYGHQAIDRKILSKIKQNKLSDLRFKFVEERNHKAKEGLAIEGLKKNLGYAPRFNLRKGDGLTPRKSKGQQSSFSPEQVIQGYLSLAIFAGVFG